MQSFQGAVTYRCATITISIIITIVIKNTCFEVASCDVGSMNMNTDMNMIASLNLSMNMSQDKNMNMVLYETI